MNISDSERIASVLESIKYAETSDIAEADLVVVTMCSVRQSAVDRVHGLTQKFKKIREINPKLKTILTGCILKKDKKIFIKGFDYIIDIKDIVQLVEIARQQIRSVPRKAILHGLPKAKNCRELSEPRAGGASDSGELLPSDYLEIVPKYSSKFSANVPIMTGCNNFCAYCVVPYTREREISRSAKEIICEIKNLVKKGYKEIWLLGQNVNSYKDGKNNFPKLLKIVNDIPGDFWIRFTSSHPKDFSDELIRAMADCDKLPKYLNLPVQAGDDKILKKMNRPYTVAQYKILIKKIKKAMPDISLSTDIIVGFPGETKKQFENTAKLFRDIKFDMAYINKYSTRAGTAAAKLKDNILPAEKKRREKFLTEILKQTALQKNKELIDKKTIILIENKKNDFWIGKNGQYKTVKIYPIKSATGGSPPKVGQFNLVKITEAMAWALKGKITNE